MLVRGALTPNRLKSRPTRAHPFFRDLVKAALKYRKSRELKILEEKESVKK
jgi:hypothetical protein